jgi:hypothetical protein
MATLLRPAQWGLQKPPPGARLQAGHPLAPMGGAYWGLADGGGGRALDLGSNAATLTISSALAWSAGRGGPALRGTGGLVTGGATSTRQTPHAPAVSAWAWVCLDSLATTNGSGLLAHHTSDGSPSDWFLYVASTGLVNVDIPWVAGGVVTGATALALGRWYLVGFTRTGASGSWTYQVWLNGRLDASATTGSNPNTGAQAFTLGHLSSTNNAYNLNGRIESAGMVPRALQGAEWQALTAAPFALIAPPAPCLRYWVVVSGGPTTTPLSLSGTQAQSGSLVRQVTHALAGTQAQSGSVARSIAHRLAGTQAQAGTLVRAVTHLLSGTQAQTGSVTRTVTHRLAGTQAQSGSIVAIKAKVVTLAGTQAQSGSLTRTVAHPLGGTQPQTGTVIRRVPRSLVGTQPQVGSVAVSTGGGVYTITGTQAQVGSVTITLVHYTPSPLPRTTHLGGSETAAIYGGSRLTTRAE